MIGFTADGRNLTEILETGTETGYVVTKMQGQAVLFVDTTF
jgi:hypothetical protein